MTITNPNWPAPTSMADCIALFTYSGAGIKAGLEWIEANQPTLEPLKVARAHGLLDRGGYIMEDVCGVPDGTFSAGGGNKPGG